MTKNKITKTIIICMLFSLYSIGQNVNTCLSIINGEKHGHLYSMLGCDIPILITATEEEGTTGSKITGTFISTETITISPGTSKVRLLPSSHPHDDNNENKTSQVHGKTHLKIKIPTNGRFANFKADNKVKLIPNPAKNRVTINTTNTVISTVTIYDLYNNILFTKNRIKDSASLIIDLTKFKSGFYVIKLQLENGKITTKTLIKQ